jgi:hypothetical protein
MDTFQITDLRYTPEDSSVMTTNDSKCLYSS